MLNILDIIFLCLAIITMVTGSLITNFENNVPAFIKKSFKYGSFAYKGTEASFLQIIEIPKSYYRHFYVFSSIFSLSALIYMYGVYFQNCNVNEYFKLFLRLSLETEHSSVCITAAFIAMLLLTVQCCKRLYETFFLQVFAKSSKMNLSHYTVGFVHYFGCVVAIIGHAPLFVGHTKMSSIVWLDKYTTIFLIPCTLTFLWACYEQFRTNMILANLRCDKTSGKLITEDHRVPHGRLFKHISSPHRMCELLMYTALLILTPTKTFFCIYLWVFANQLQTAIQVHDWYRATFKTYPKNRMAVIPNYL